MSDDPPARTGSAGVYLVNQGVLGRLTVAVLAYNRPAETERCVLSVRQYIKDAPLAAQILCLSNGGDQDLARHLYDTGLVDTLLLNRCNVGCGIAMKQMAQAALTEWVMMVQSDQYAIRPYGWAELSHHIEYLQQHPEVLYVDLAGDQGHGRPSERAHLINRRRYLDLPGMDDVIGGPGPYAASKWTEQHVQEHCVRFVSAAPLFADNGAWSEREYPVEYGQHGLAPRTRHRTDTKRLWVLSPFSRRVEGFPNLTLSEEEWSLVLDGKWPEEGRIPEADKPHSFVAWPE